MPAEELIAKWGVGKGYCYAVENPTIFMKSSPFLGHISRDRVLHLEPKEIAENL